MFFSDYLVQLNTFLYKILHAKGTKITILSSMVLYGILGILDTFSTYAFVFVQKCIY
jgi:fluoride ion exporter CrcB/FEX